jgi:LEA14-like dessication related protein
MKTVYCLFAVVLVIASCATLEKIVQAPDVKVDSVQISDISFSDVTLDFNLLIQNPNGFGVSLGGFDYSFSLQDKEVLKGDEDKEISLAASANSALQIPLTLNFQDVYALAKETKDLDSLSYHLAGHFKPSGILSEFKIPFSKTGTLPNMRLPRLSLKSLKLNKLNFSGVEMGVALDVDNPNMFGFDIGKFDYKISLAGNQVAEGATLNLAQIPAKQSGTINLPISFSFFGVASTLSSALTGKSIDCAVEGNAAVNTPLGEMNLPIAVSQRVEIFK